MDWFYRKGGRAFLWLARKPVQIADTFVGELYRVAGLVAADDFGAGGGHVR